MSRRISEVFDCSASARCQWWQRWSTMSQVQVVRRRAMTQWPRLLLGEFQMPHKGTNARWDGTGCQRNKHKRGWHGLSKINGQLGVTGKGENSATHRRTHAERVRLSGAARPRAMPIILIAFPGTVARDAAAGLWVRAGLAMQQIVRMAYRGVHCNLTPRRPRLACTCIHAACSLDPERPR